ncbi:hypothetical protein GCM10022384_13650 [Streptomyces marokkonensis]|uniref:Uncharacterized protein n=1 Tax=Streptomyces marokkonensis TaxID=324855 RepID=A0ABP7PB58_9ACTN
MGWVSVSVSAWAGPVPAVGRAEVEARVSGRAAPVARAPGRGVAGEWASEAEAGAWGAGR